MTSSSLESNVRHRTSEWHKLILDIELNMTEVVILVNPGYRISTTSLTAIVLAPNEATPEAQDHDGPTTNQPSKPGQSKSVEDQEQPRNLKKHHCLQVLTNYFYLIDVADEVLGSRLDDLAEQSEEAGQEDVDCTEQFADDNLHKEDRFQRVNSQCRVL
ncbi:hypothetical protein PR048_028305 [Dryococelus australis]|uniref:Uncharacterized protein n=1 Tax=Dryococelus australis TaxID=614101 RepID=A0ABQ9GIV9_9NEOP|nr:hypothetical protein PR048_028305 [Dryococelus australis]